MKKIKVFNSSKEIFVLQEVEVADSFWYRFKGLMGRAFLEEGKGMLIIPCSHVHTLGMKFSLDIAFLDSNNRVCHLLTGVPAGKLFLGSRYAASVLEAAAGSFAGQKLEQGDHLEFEEVLC